MTQSKPQRMTAEIDGDFVVFLIGMRINKPWKVHKWLPVFLAMPRMLKELRLRPESGFLGCTMGFPVIVQYWRSFEHLESYARSKDLAHWPAWVAFNKNVGGSRGDVGIWHETTGSPPDSTKRSIRACHRSVLARLANSCPHRMPESRRAVGSRRRCLLKD
jgi:hypothetical protein